MTSSTSVKPASAVKESWLDGGRIGEEPFIAKPTIVENRVSSQKAGDKIQRLRTKSLASPEFRKPAKQACMVFTALPGVQEEPGWRDIDRHLPHCGQT